MSKIQDLLRQKRIDVQKRKSLRKPVLSEKDSRVNWDRDRFRILAEIKRSSLSAGTIRQNLNPAELARAYAAAGAAAISVLTEEHYFHGSLHDLKSVSNAVSIPVLQKDFVIDEYQILEAKEAGANLVLLIARFLTESEIASLLGFCEKIRIDAIVEVSNQEDLKKITEPVRFLGVNARDLETLRVDTTRFERLRDGLPDAYWIAESGITNIEMLQRLLQLGYRGALIGEHFLRAGDPAAELCNFQSAINVVLPNPVEKGQPKVKICGITSERDADLAMDAGASGLGFIFADSPRRITAEVLNAFRDRIPKNVECVGVFRGVPQNEVESIMNGCRLDIAQCYDLFQIKVSTWDARTVNSVEEIETLQEYKMGNLLVDVKLPDRELPNAWRRLGSVFALAGGLHAGNVAEAISVCRPVWVDVARGVESEPGLKDANKVREFMKAVNGK